MEVGLDGAPGVAAVLPAAADYRHACAHVPIHLRQVAVLPVKGVVPNLNPVTRMIVQVKYRNHVCLAFARRCMLNGISLTRSSLNTPKCQSQFVFIFRNKSSFRFSFLFLKSSLNIFGRIGIETEVEDNER